MTTDVVIGAASGMGAAVARRLAGQGRRLVLADVDAGGVQRLAADIGGDVESRQCDLSDAAGVSALADATGEFGRLVLTAGLSPTMAPGRRIYEVDIVAPARLLETFEPRAGEGSVALLLASTAGHMAPAQPEIDAVLDRPLAASFLEDLVAAGIDVDDSNFAYTFSKRALMRLVRRASVPWGARGARVLSVSPGVVDTGMGQQELAAQPIIPGMIAASPLGRIIEPDEVAAVVEFLVSEAASAMTGSDVLVDGGSIAQIMG